MAETLNNVLVVRATHNDGTANDETYTMARAATIVDFIVIATDGNSGSVTLRNGANAVSGALDPGAAGDTRLFRSITGDTWTSAQRAIAAGTALTFDPAATTGDWEAYAYLYPTPAVAE